MSLEDTLHFLDKVCSHELSTCPARPLLRWGCRILLPFPRQPPHFCGGYRDDIWHQLQGHALPGGLADKSFKRFVELAGGPKAKIAILPHSSSVPIESADETANIFASLGVKSTVAIQPTGNQALPADVTAVWMTGGDQNRLMRLADKTLLDQVRDFLKNGGVVGGTSAGAAVVPPQMIAGGMDDGFPRGASLRLSDGLGLLPGFIVDTHVKQRERHDRIMAALAMLDGVKGIGLDEDTAIEIVAGKGTVYGDGCVRFYERGAGFKSDLTAAKDQDKASVRNVLYSVIPEGETLDL